MATPEPWCPVREEPCSLCQLNVTGPADCGLVYLMREDADPWEAIPEGPGDGAFPASNSTERRTIDPENSGRTG